MAKPKYAGKRKQPMPAPLVGVLVPKNEEKPIILQELRTNETLKQYASLTAMHILQTWSALATADVTEIVRVEKHACRFCHGVMHRYQWVNEDEWAESVAIDLDLGRETKNCEGGFGYSPKAKAHENCPKCHGEGVAEVVMTDYRELSPAARLLFNGAKQTKYGIEIMLRDRDKLLELAGKHLGMFKEHVEHSGKGGGPINFVLSPAEAAL